MENRRPELPGCYGRCHSEKADRERCLGIAGGCNASGELNQSGYSCHSAFA